MSAHGGVLLTGVPVSDDTLLKVYEHGMTRYRLSPRQRELATTLLQPADYHSIAAGMGTSWHTVREQLRCIRVKTNARSELEIVLILLGLLTREEPP